MAYHWLSSQNDTVCCSAEKLQSKEPWPVILSSCASVHIRMSTFSATTHIDMCVLKNINCAYVSVCIDPCLCAFVQSSQSLSALKGRWIWSHQGALVHTWPVLALYFWSLSVITLSRSLPHSFFLSLSQAPSPTSPLNPLSPVVCELWWFTVIIHHWVIYQACCC